jgi:hypothetical protein
MATRYCGKVKIDCKLVRAPHMPHGEQYKCNISIGGKKLCTDYVGIPAHLTHAIDSPRAYDSAASAALAFASNGPDACVDDSDIEIVMGKYATEYRIRRTRHGH